MDAAAWLRGLGLSVTKPLSATTRSIGKRYPKLTTEDLKDLGLVLGSHRRKLLEAIAALRDKTDAGVEQASSTVPAAERRRLTVMFCDLVDSTALSSRLDPEDLREVIAAYHRAVAEIVAGIDCFVAKYTPKPATFSRRSTTGSPKASTYKTSKWQRRCSTRSMRSRLRFW